MYNVNHMENLITCTSFDYYDKKVYTVMVINSTNINKTNNHLVIITEPLNTIKTTIYDVGNPGPGLEQAQ